MSKQPETTSGDQIKASVGGMQAGMLAVGQEMERRAVERGDILTEELDEPVQLSFGRFSKKTRFKHGCNPGMRLQAPAEEGGADVVAIGLKSDTGTQMVEIGRNPKDEQGIGIKPSGNPESDFILVVHGDAPQAYFVGGADIGRLAEVGRPFQFGSTKSLGEVFQGGEIEKVTTYSKPV